MSTAEALITIAVVAVLTFLLRFLPFLLFGRKERPSPVLDSLNKLLPSAIIAVLVVYCLKNVSFQQINTFVPELIAVAVVVLLHLWKRNNLVSIGGGTVVYMLLVQLVF
ncbi:MAG: branched-chain amino acid transporter permease [Saccharofermentanales bacterium]|jgi:branched-subunit amino acid transport protein AzlD|nr:branched-chain amino acid transporter AzlD [Clostridiaceae bacterium]